ncbi:hypothetical protein ABZ705_13005 [Streptomyces sp. NPDC006984]|uniref:hypothetical protein n=1 Tax=Streptomyces sp. NPDC006984 TaxID=3155463 RepID=UPI0033CE1D6A
MDIEKSAEWFTAGQGRRLSLALGVPLAAVGLAVGAEMLAGTGGPVAVYGLLWLLVPAVLALDLLAHFLTGVLDQRPVLYGAGAAAMVVALGTGVVAADGWVLRTHGVPTECTVTDVSGVWVREPGDDDSDFVYRHRLDCPDGGPEIYDTNLQEKPGTRLALVYHPTGQSGPERASFVASAPYLLGACGALVATASLLRGLGVRRGKRS